MNTRPVDSSRKYNSWMLNHPRKWGTASFLVISAFTAAGAAASNPPRFWLEPCRTLADATSEDLEIQRRRVDTLKLDTYPFPNSGYPIARLIVEPSFTPDWAVSLYQAKDDDC
jgi:hypothetical protein